MYSKEHNVCVGTAHGMFTRFNHSYSDTYFDELLSALDDSFFVFPIALSFFHKSDRFGHVISYRSFVFGFLYLHSRQLIILFLTLM